MTEISSVPSPEPYGLVSFADVLLSRDPIIGEAPGAFEFFHAEMLKVFRPKHPYACVLVENLIDIEWEIVQQRHMRDASLRQVIYTLIRDALFKLRQLEHENEEHRLREEHLEAGGSEYSFQPTDFDSDGAQLFGHYLAERAMSRDRAVRDAALAELVKLGLKPIDVMSEAHAGGSPKVVHHDSKARSLEDRRREVKRDFEAAQKMIYDDLVDI